MFPASYISSLKGMSCIRGCSSLEVPNEILYLEGSYYLCEMEVKSGMKFQTMFNMCGVCTAHPSCLSSPSTSRASMFILKEIEGKGVLNTNSGSAVPSCQIPLVRCRWNNAIWSLVHWRVWIVPWTHLEGLQWLLITQDPQWYPGFTAICGASFHLANVIGGNHPK